MKTDRRDAGSLMITVIAMIFIVSIIIFAGSTLVRLYVKLCGNILLMV